MKAEDIVIGGTYSINGNGDLFFEGEARPFINEDVTVLKRCKGGKYQVQLPDGRVKSFALRNLSPKMSERPPRRPLTEDDLKAVDEYDILSVRMHRAYMTVGLYEEIDRYRKSRG